MTKVLFYEKPGCINNTKQKQWLIDSGHNVEARNILTYPWSREDLRQFFQDSPIPTWFNPSAPAIKSGEIDPLSLNSDDALTRMLENPILIRRPLLEIEGNYLCGFNVEYIDRMFGLSAYDGSSNPEVCPRPETPCDDRFHWFNSSPSAKPFLIKSVDHWENREKASSYIQKAIQADPDNTDVRVAAYRFFFYKHMFEDAATQLQTLIKLLSNELNLPEHLEKQLPLLKLKIDEPRSRLLISCYSAYSVVLARLERMTEADKIASQIEQLGDKKSFGADFLHQAFNAEESE